MKAAGIHMTAVVVTGGAIGFAIGIGLQKIGSNLVSGMMLLISKPLRLGDVITFEKGFAGASWGWITQMDLMYVHVATRNGSLLLVPNEVFLTQKIENLSYDNNRVRLIIPFAIAYDSDLVKAKTLAASAAGSVARILKIPEPKCYVREYEDSTVNLELRVWIDDPKNGMGNVRDAVRMAVWDSYRANGVEFAFPQRDLHIKNAVPLEIIRKSAPPVEMNSGDPDGN
jgi:small-conductance mechanosensitive channel